MSRVRVRFLIAEVGRRGTEPDEIDDLKDAESVDNEEGDEPPFLFVTSGMPEREAFEDESPEHNHKKNR